MASVDRPRGASVPTVARGVAGAALLACVWVGMLAAQRRWPAAAEPPPAWCAAPVEVGTADGRGRLGCADEQALRRCGPLEAGDRADLSDARCAVEPHGMRAGWRVLRGLPIDLQRASSDDLQLLDGIGPKTAARILAYRARVGRFRDLQELRHVAGIGPKTVAKLRGLLSVDLTVAGGAAQPRRAMPEGCAARPGQSIGERCNVDG